MALAQSRDTWRVIEDCLEPVIPPGFFDKPLVIFWGESKTMGINSTYIYIYYYMGINSTLPSWYGKTPYSESLFSVACCIAFSLPALQRSPGSDFAPLRPPWPSKHVAMPTLRTCCLASCQPVAVRCSSHGFEFVGLVYIFSCLDEIRHKNSNIRPSKTHSLWVFELL